MGTVYRATDPRLGRAVAIKVLKENDADSWPRFIAEARAQAQIDHPNVCRVYDTGASDGLPFIVMQLIEGGSLLDIAESLTLEQQVRIMQQIAMAVHEAHRSGIIHRDIKPANVLVETQNGTHKPYIVDFGLSRQAGQQGQTQTGVVLGTLSYMSPEQAQGEWRAIDRRSDVYSLGATLYDLIAGRPPFVSEQTWGLLYLVLNQDAVALGKVKEGVPSALETIVMKCLEREPARRYDSARALADDLQRFLDGDAIVAKPPSLPRVLKNKVRANKVATALLGSLLAGAIALGGVWVHAARQAEEQARVAREVGGAVKEMELFLRTAYSLPLHDVERERDIVRRRLVELSGGLAEAGPASEGPLQCALGQGYLALGDPARAADHLERARQAGYEPPELRYALGEALGELFRAALAETKRITSEDERKRKVAELERDLRDPALSHLRAAVGAHLEVPAYAEGLIALHEGRNEDAVAKAREAFAAAPWMYEAKKLEGDALFAEGSKYRHDAAFDYDKMRSYFDPADRAYAVAAEIGRSDPSVHLARCALWEKVEWAAFNKVLPIEPSFDEADAACRRALEASPGAGRALVQRALALSVRVFAELRAPSTRTLDVADEAVDAAEESELTAPDDIMTYYSTALALSLRSQVEIELGLGTSMAPAIDAYERVLTIDPRFTWAINELGQALSFESTWQEKRGIDASESRATAIRVFERAIALDPKFALPVGGRLRALQEQVEVDTDRGRDAAPSLKALSDASSALDNAGFGPWLAAFWKARSERLQAQCDVAWARDPRRPITAALAAIRAFAGDSPADPWFLEEIARCRLLEAMHAFKTGVDAGPALALARDAAQKAREKNAKLEIVSAQIELVAARAGSSGDGARPWDAALSFVAPLLAGPERDPAPFALAAEILAGRAGAMLKASVSPDDDVRRGLEMANAALAINPVMARALLAKSQLYTIQARSARSGEARAGAARLAEEGLTAAVRYDPLLENERAAARSGDGPVR